MFGFLSIMCYAGVIKPLYAEIVPPHMIAQVVALGAAIDGAFASIASTPVVGFITQHFFHYISTNKPIKNMPTELRTTNALALGRSIAWVTVCSATIALIVYSFLHLTYSKDIRASKRKEADSLPAVEDGDSSAAEKDEEGGKLVKTSSGIHKTVSFNLPISSSCAH